MESDPEASRGMRNILTLRRASARRRASSCINFPRFLVVFTQRFMKVGAIDRHSKGRDGAQASPLVLEEAGEGCRNFSSTTSVRSHLEAKPNRRGNLR